MLGGLMLTFELAAIAISGGLIWGTLLAMARLSHNKWLYFPASVYIHFFRGVPLILVIFWLYFLMPVLVGRSINEFIAASVSFIVYEAAYFSEIIRAGLQSIPQGQKFAGLATGLTPSQNFHQIILPQALRHMTPSLITHAVVIFQDTSLSYVIGLREFLRRVNLIDAREFRSVELYAFAAFIYFVICTAGALAGRGLEPHRNAGADHP